jgi:hypothetical protein
MRLDIRWPLGLLFLITGGMMAIYGALTHGSAIYEKSLGMDINLIWGLVLLGFGMVMLLLAWTASRRPPSDATSGDELRETRPRGH